MSSNGSTTTQRPPRDGLVRAMFPAVELVRSESQDGGDPQPPVMRGHFAVFNTWTEINSLFEGNFMERFAPGAFKKTIAEQRDEMRVLFQHGHDPMLGDKPLGPIRTLEEDKRGAYYEVDLLDAEYVRDLVLPGLEAGLYGASFRFGVLREEWVDQPDPSPTNPHGIPERTVLEARVPEFGPVTFPAYKDATAGVRSITDEAVLSLFAKDPERLRAMVDHMRTTENYVTPVVHETPRGAPDSDESTDTQDDAPPTDDAGPKPTSSPGRRDATEYLYGLTARKESPSWRL